jgi:hypothetical protein
VLAFPFDGAWAAGTTVTSDGTGAFRGRVAITRNSRLRAVVAGPAGDTASPEVGVGPSLLPGRVARVAGEANGIGADGAEQGGPGDGPGALR